MFGVDTTFQGPSPVEISEVCESRDQNVAHGLAWSFYLGYLKLVLPELPELVSKDYSVTRDKLTSSRLHILLPLSAVATARLEEEDRSIRFQRNLPELRIDRAGVRNRVYKHSVYKITDQNQKEYSCVVEYATPLLTLYQMSQDNTAGLGQQERRQQVFLFYRTLSHILENSLECRNRYCLVLLDDKQAGERHLSKELIRHLQQQEEEIPVEPPRELPHPRMEEGEKNAPVLTQQADPQEEPTSSLPSLMISGPRTLRSEPVENTDYGHNHR
ncbi:stimulator of interferon genes protein isoform X2 [Brachyhypopomus gauderio]|uniref:stimulator of interferon genes protein isoform X2 n=1 Tax=Brachyhypopomus gauderio TaxID=698409 RepID=UPI0040419720